MHKAIQAAFGLTEDDIRANSAGRLAGIQKRKLAHKVAELRGTILLLLILLCLLLSFGAIPIRATAPTFVVLLLFGAGIIDRSIRSIRASKDLAQGCVEQVKGRIHLKPFSTTSAQMQIENLKFNITTAQLLALRNEMPYTVYFSPRSKVLLAAAPIQEDEVEPSELVSSELLLNDEKPKRSQVALGDDGELIDLETSRSKQRGI